MFETSGEKLISLARVWSVEEMQPKRYRRIQDVLVYRNGWAQEPPQQDGNGTF